MYDHRSPPPTNGHQSLPPPSLLGILLGIKEDLGGLKAGQTQSLANDSEIFDQIRGIRDRVTTIEQRPSAGQHPTEPRGSLTGITAFLKELGAVLSGTWRLAALAAWAVTAAGVTYNAEAFVALIRSLK